MDTEYVVDCAFELGETTALECAVLSHRKGAYEVIRHAVDNNLAFPEHFLVNSARQAFQEAKEQDQHLFSLLALPALSYGLKAFHERSEHLVQSLLQRQLLLDTTHAPLFLPELSNAPTQYVQREEDISEGLVRQVLTDMLEPQAQRWREDFQAMHRACAWLSRNGVEGLARLELMPQSVKSSGAVNAQAAVLRLQQERQTKLRQAQQQELRLHQRAKSAIKKATKLFESLGQRNNLSLFVSGHEVVLSHPESMFKFVLKPLNTSGWLVERTMQGRSHTPYELLLLTKEDVHLARLCVYFEATPVLDQLLSLSLFVHSGDEMRILETANWFAHGQWSPELRQQVLAAHPQLERKLPRQLADGETQESHRVVVDERFMRLQRHWEPYKGRVEQWIRTWMEPLTQQALGFANETQLIEGTLRELQELRNLEYSRSQPQLLAA